MCDTELKLEAADGENVTIPFKTPDLDRAEQVILTFTQENQTNVTARYCRCDDCGDCNVVETQGVLLRVKEGTLTLLRVNSRNSGLYEVIIIGKKVARIKAILVVNSEYVITIYLLIYISIMRKNHVNGNDCVHKVMKNRNLQEVQRSCPCKLCLCSIQFSWSHEFDVLTSRNLLDLKVASLWTVLKHRYTIENRQQTLFAEILLMWLHL